MYFHVKNLQVENCLLENGQEPVLYIYSHFNFWIHMSGRNLDGLGADVLPP